MTKYNILCKILNTDLLKASRKKNIEVVKLFLENGADVNVQDNEDWTALMFASYVKNKAMVELLLKHNANVNIKNCNGHTALTCAKVMFTNRLSANIYKEIIELLKQYGAK